MIFRLEVIPFFCGITMLIEKEMNERIALPPKLLLAIANILKNSVKKLKRIIRY